MAEKQSDQTEKPTPKKIQDSRKEGQVHKSQDLSKTFLLLYWLLAIWAFSGMVFKEINKVFNVCFEFIASPSKEALINASYIAVKSLLAASLPIIFAAAILGIFIEYVQVGPIFASKKLTPKFENLNPVQGLKKMFSAQNLVELVKGIAKIILIGWIAYLVIWNYMSDYLQITYGPIHSLLGAFWQTFVFIFGGIIFVFLFVSILDAFYQHHAYIKNLMMSKRDIQQEHKNSEGDPMVKGQRKQLHQEWSQQNMLGSVRKANVIVTNPTHIAVALYYERGETDLPRVVAKGEGEMARRIREAAQEADVPIMENIPLARGLYRDIEIDRYITSDFFEAVAELLRWANELSEKS